MSQSRSPIQFTQHRELVFGWCRAGEPLGWYPRR